MSAHVPRALSINASAWDHEGEPFTFAVGATLYPLPSVLCAWVYFVMLQACICYHTEGVSLYWSLPMQYYLVALVPAVCS